MQDANSEVFHLAWEPGEGEGMLVGGLDLGVCVEEEMWERED